MLNANRQLSSPRGSPNERIWGGGKSHSDPSVLGTPAGRALEREHRVLQAAGGRGRSVGQRGHGGHAQPDHLHPRRAQEVDRVPHLGSGRHLRGRRPPQLSHHCQNP